MKLRKNQQGFSVVEVLLVLIFVAIVFFIGFYVAHAQKDKTTPTTTTAATAQKADTETKSNTLKYLTIKEWGVKVPYAGDDTLSYSMGTDSPATATIISANLAAKYNCTTMGAGEVQRYDQNSQYPASVDTFIRPDAAASADPSSWGHVGIFYFHFVHDQGACSDSVTADAQNTVNEFTKKLVPQFAAE